MLYGEKLKEICGKLGVDPNTLPDKLYSTLLNEICDCCGSGSGGGDDETLKGLIERSATSITIPDGTTSINWYAFAYCGGLISIEIPNSVTSIGPSAFKYCDSLTSVTIPNSVTLISTSAFEYCTSLTSITIPNSVTSISAYSFEGCTSLTSITIPNSVTLISNSALTIGSSSNKATIRFEGTTPPTISSDTFNTSYLQAIEVPMSAVDTYKAATNWSNFADYIVGYEE